MSELFIVGSTYSGTTVAYRLMAYHPDLGWFSQFSLRDGSIPGRARLPFSATWDRVARRLAPHPWTKNTHARGVQRLLARLIPSPSEGIPMWEFALPNHKFVRYGRDDAAALAPRALAVVRGGLQATGKRRLLAKMPRFAQSVPALAELFPHSQFLHVVRDGKAVAVSGPREHALGTPESLEAVRKRSLQWRETVAWMRRMEEELGSGRVRTIRYEDLCADVRGTIRSVWAWAGLADAPRALRRVPETIRATNDPQFDRTPPPERAAILEALGEDLALAGYPGYPRSWAPAGAGAA